MAHEIMTIDDHCRQRRIERLEERRRKLLWLGILNEVQISILQISISRIKLLQMIFDKED